MMSLVYIICAGLAVAFAYKLNVILGIIVSLGIFAYAAYSYIPTFWAVKAQKAFVAGDFKAAKRLYKKAIDTNRAKVQIKISYAYTLMRTGDFDEAERILDNIIRVRAMKKEEYRYNAKQQRCMVYYKQGRLDEALEEAYEMFNSGYKNTQLYGMIGYFRLKKGDNIDDVTRFCEEAYEYNSDDRDIMDNLSLCYYEKGEYEKAEELSDKIIADAPKFVEAYYHGAQIAVKRGEYKKAKELLSHVDDCRWSNMTTVSREEIADLEKQIDRKLRLK